MDGAEAGAFDQAITKADPAMVMMSLATYQSIDPNNPAVFSSTIIDGHIRNVLKYTGVVISDSMSAEALSSYDVSQLGVNLVEAGGDMSCIGQTDYVKPIVDGLNERAKSDPAFASKVTAAATRVMTLKIKMGLAVVDRVERAAHDADAQACMPVAACGKPAFAVAAGPGRYGQVGHAPFGFALGDGNDFGGLGGFHCFFGLN